MKLRSAAEDPGASGCCVSAFPNILRRVEKALSLTNVLKYFTDTVEGSAASWCSTLIQTLPLYNDRASRRAVLGVLRTALRNETFLKTFTAMLVRTDGSKVSRQDSCTLFMWSCAVLQELQLPAALKAAQKIMECQVNENVCKFYDDGGSWTL